MWEISSNVIVPGFVSPESSIQDWGPSYASHGIVAMTIGTNHLLEQPAGRAAALLDAIVSLRAEHTRSSSPLEEWLDLDRIGAVVVPWLIWSGQNDWLASSSYHELIHYKILQNRHPS